MLMMKYDFKRCECNESDSHYTPGSKHSDIQRNPACFNPAYRCCMDSAVLICQYSSAIDIDFDGIPTHHSVNLFLSQQEY